MLKKVGKHLCSFSCLLAVRDKWRAFFCQMCTLYTVFSDSTVIQQTSSLPKAPQRERKEARFYWSLQPDWDPSQSKSRRVNFVWRWPGVLASHHTYILLLPVTSCQCNAWLYIWANQWRPLWPTLITPAMNSQILALFNASQDNSLFVAVGITDQQPW